MKAITEIFRRLRVKVSSLILAILVLGFGILVILNISRETELLVAENLTTARLLATTIKISVDNGMLEARPDIISGLVRNLKSELKDVRRLEVYRRNGVEAFSDLDTLNEVHTILGLDPDLYARIAKGYRAPSIQGRLLFADGTFLYGEQIESLPSSEVRGKFVTAVTGLYRSVRGKLAP